MPSPHVILIPDSPERSPKRLRPLPTSPIVISSRSPTPSPTRSSSSLEIISHKPPNAALSPAPTPTNPTSDVAIVASRTGINALADYPHFRFQCAVHPHIRSSPPSKGCIRCFCYVCDSPVSQCPLWDIHFSATDKLVVWRARRAEAKMAQRGRSGSRLRQGKLTGANTAVRIAPAPCRTTDTWDAAISATRNREFAHGRSTLADDRNAFASDRSMTATGGGGFGVARRGVRKVRGRGRRRGALRRGI